jgi:hypothetical protein
MSRQGNDLGHKNKKSANFKSGRFFVQRNNR